MAVQESTENVGFTIRTYLGALSDWFYVKYRKTVSIVNLNSVEAVITIPYALYDILEVTVIFTMEGNVVDDIDLVLSSEMIYCEEFNKYLGFCCKVSPLDLFKTNDFNSLFFAIEKMYQKYVRFHENKVIPLLDDIDELDFLNNEDLFCQLEEIGNYTIRQIFCKVKIFDKFLIQEKKDYFLEAGYSHTDAVFDMQVWCFIESRLVMSSETWKTQKIQFFTLPKWKDLIEKNIMADILKYRKNFTTTKYMKAVLVSLKDSVNGHLHMKTRRDFMAKLLIEYGEDIVYFDSENFASCQMHIKLFQELGGDILLDVTFCPDMQQVCFSAEARKIENEEEEDAYEVIAEYEVSYQNEKDPNGYLAKFKSQVDALIQYVWKDLFYKPKKPVEPSDEDDKFFEDLMPKKPVKPSDDEDKFFEDSS